MNFLLTWTSEWFSQPIIAHPDVVDAVFLLVYKAAALQLKFLRLRWIVLILNRYPLLTLFHLLFPKKIWLTKLVRIVIQLSLIWVSHLIQHHHSLCTPLILLHCFLKLIERTLGTQSNPKAQRLEMFPLSRFRPISMTGQVTYMKRSFLLWGVWKIVGTIQKSSRDAYSCACSLFSFLRFLIFAIIVCIWYAIHIQFIYFICLLNIFYTFFITFCSVVHGWLFINFGRSYLYCSGDMNIYRLSTLIIYSI